MDYFQIELNGQNSSSTNVHAGIPKGSILGPLLFIIYINNLSDNLISNAKFFADDTSLFSVVRNVNISAKELDDDLKKDNDWTLQWKMSSKSEQTSPGSYFQSQIKETELPIFRIQQ